jgi:formylglycine-generating enzyme required for sulfatase activity
LDTVSKVLAILAYSFTNYAYGHQSAALIWGDTNTLELVFFPSNTFKMGCPEFTKVLVDTASKKCAQPEHFVSLSAFWIGKYPITVGQYCTFLNAVGFRTEFTEKRGLLRDIEHKVSFKPRPLKANFPAGYVSLMGAVSFCEWLSTATHRKCRLPTEAEWEFVAKGVQGRTYPWGETPSTTNPYGCRVGENPTLATPDGVEDLNGPVYQYCLDRFDCSFYKHSPNYNPLSTNGVSCVVRGGPMFMFMERLGMPATWKRFQSLETNMLSGFRIVVEHDDLKYP